MNSNQSGSAEGPVRTIQAEEALRLLQSTHILENLRVAGYLNMLHLATGEASSIGFPVRFVNCSFDDLDSSVVWYEAPVHWNRCEFRKIWMNWPYFGRGLEARACTFESPVLFQSGGHNQKDAPILFEHVTFHRFVDFFDCWFTGPVILRDVEFAEGTNLLSEEKGWVKFDMPPVLEDVRGPLDVSLNLDFKDRELVIDVLGPRARAKASARRDEGRGLVP